jgi:aryl-alcohol dehydrogenase-like predicted oxidoreductase
MNHRPFGRTGVQVSPLCLGAMMFGAWGNPDHEDGIAIIHRALDAGINFIDTADVYSRGESEEIVGKALAGRRDDVVLATKVHGTIGDDPAARVAELVGVVAHRAVDLGGQDDVVAPAAG